MLFNFQCAENYPAVNFGEVLKCFKDGRGHEFHYQNGLLTTNLRPPVSFIPTIVIDKVCLFNLELELLNTLVLMEDE